MDVLGRVPQPMRVLMLAELARHRAQLDHAEALILDAMATDPEPYPGDLIACEKQYVREEVAAALKLAPVTAGARLYAAERLCERFPDALALMASGDLSERYATRLVELTDELSDGHAAKVATRVLGRAPQQTISQFAASVRRAVLAVDPATAEERHDRSRENRDVAFGPVGTDGMLELRALLPADQAAELRARVDALADAWTKADPHDARTADQRRADALCALGSDTSPIRPQVNVGIALSTLLDLDDKPGTVNGDPVAASIARSIAFDPTGRWRRLLVDDQGHLIDASSQNYRVPEPMSRFVKLRDVTCQWWGCQRPAVYCEDDHTIRWLVSHDTSPRNLRCLCATTT